jgi:hypothetical protein
MLLADVFRQSSALLWTSSAMVAHTLEHRHGHMEAFTGQKHSMLMSLAWCGPVIPRTKAQVSFQPRTLSTQLMKTNKTGWYDLYDSDTAMDIVYAQQQTIAGWIRWNGSNGTQHT